ncbi:MAG: hypothetical protein H7Y13_00955 [Sphingobacteriaceae bacterium]|nr:hypothetical protein [Sphingobacteriaceae bacterium]
MNQKKLRLSLLLCTTLISIFSCKKEIPSTEVTLTKNSKNQSTISAVAANPPASAQRLEAESGTLTNGAVKVADGARSGGNYVAQNSGNISIIVNISTTNYYNIYINAAAPYGEKTNIISIDGVNTNFTLTNNSSYLNYRLINSYRLTAGTHTIAIKNSWGYINIDYLSLEIVNPASRFNINTSLVTPGATTQANKVYQFLRNNYGTKIISGVMTLNSFDETNWLKTNTGKEPAILGLDFMHVNRNYTWYDNKTPIRDAKTWWDRNGIPVLIWHWRDPSRRTEEFYTSKTTFDVSKITSTTSAEYKAMISDIDYISGLLKELQTQGVPVIWRPLHEAAGGWFWWGAKGAAPCKKLYQVMYDRMVNYHGLKNLIWVWTREPNDQTWYPGDQYVDIVGRDIYQQGNHTSQSVEFNNMNTLYGGKKMVSITECGSMPDPDNLVKDAAAWSWFMPWYGDYTRNSTHNSLDLWKKTLNHTYVITLDEMPSLK